MRVYKILLLLAVLWGSFSCVPYRKTILLNEERYGKADTSISVAPEYKIQPGDLLYISVQAPDPSSVMIFNRQVGVGSSGMVNDAALYLKSYTVDDAGNVLIPLVGKVSVVGKTLKEASASLISILSEYYNYVDVDVKLTNFYITILGEVKLPGTKPVYNTSFTLLQAIAQYNGFTEYADLKNLQVIRKINDKTHIAYVDITDPNFINSEYYYLHSNDVIIVRHLKAKLLRTNATPISIAVSVLTLLLLIRNISRN